MAQNIPPRISAFAIYQRSKEEREREAKWQADKTKVLCYCEISGTRPQVFTRTRPSLSDSLDIIKQLLSYTFGRILMGLQPIREARRMM